MSRYVSTFLPFWASARARRSASVPMAVEAVPMAMRRSRRVRPS